jgi:phosphoribosylamine---glycine ligase
VPTAAFGTFASHDEATAYVKRTGAPCVVKADGLAAGKGVFICHTEAEALDALDQVMRARVFGDAGGRVVVEELLEGEELSFMALTDGETILPLAGSQDHKRIGDGDTGPNTGGMGAYSPPPLATPELEAIVMRDVIRPVVEGLARDGIRYTGILYAGLMVKNGKPSVLEFNVRLGDPEAQVLLARFASDLADVMVRTCDGRLAGTTIAWDPRAAVCVVLAAEGYPGTPKTGVPIEGLESLRDWKDGVVFHAGTNRADGRVVVDGGRVLGVTALGDTIRSAVDEAYRGVDRISWPGMQHRRDIGHRALARGGR